MDARPAGRRRQAQAVIARHAEQARRVRGHVMFESFNDQQNTVLGAKQPGDARRGLYLQAGDLKEQVLTF